MCVYGTLKKGHHNHRCLGNSKFLGEYLTLPEYTMYSMGGFPAITKDGSTPIHTEVYEVTDPNTLEDIYNLEGYSGIRNHPNNWYNTTSVNTPYGEAEMFYFDRNIDRPVVKSGNWK